MRHRSATTGTNGDSFRRLEGITGLAQPNLAARAPAEQRPRRSGRPPAPAPNDLLAEIRP
jgi:hypothetical protein